MTRQNIPTGLAHQIAPDAQSNTKKDSSVQVVVNVLTVNIFFDGTGNNLYNIKSGRRLDGSYTNALSNIAHLYEYGQKTTKNTLWVYIEGIGTARGIYDKKLAQKTSSGLSDSIKGMATGTGYYGIESRANVAFHEIKEEVQRQYSQKIQVTRLVINAFGFSRGAATARHFVNLAKTNPNRFRDFGINRPEAVQINFVGLYDTVSSFGINFDDDETDLMLSFERLSTQPAKPKVFQIVARDEYRENFSITHIQSARNKGFGIEVSMNGAHSDIGGGYHQTESEQYEVLASNQKLRNWLITQGFYKEFKDQYNYIGKDHRKVLTHCRATRQVRHDIHKVSLRMMRTAAKNAIHGIEFTKSIEPIEDITGIVQTEMGDFAPQITRLCQQGWNVHPQIIPLAIKNPNNLASLRYQYVHWSAKYIYGIATDDIGLKVRLGKDGLPYRKSFNG